MMKRRSKRKTTEEDVSLLEASGLEGGDSPKHDQERGERKRSSKKQRRSGERRGSLITRYQEAHANFVLATSGVSLLLLFVRDAKEFVINLTSLAGPFLVFAFVDFFTTNKKIKDRDRLINYVYTVVFATTASGIVSTKLAWIDLLYLNVSGAFLNAFLYIIIQNHQRLTHDSLDVLDCFRGTFCGVWTSFAGLVYFSGLDPRGIGPGVMYYVITMTFGVVGHELGLRFGGKVADSRFALNNNGRALKIIQKWLPYICAYVSTHCFLSRLVPDPSNHLIWAYLFSVIGCLFGEVIDVSPDSVVQDFISNVVAVLIVAVVQVSCNNSFGKVHNRQLCTSGPRAELENSAAGALSTFCGSAAAHHAFYVSLLPEDVMEDWYYNRNDSMRETLGYYEDEKQRQQAILKNGLRIGGEFSLVLALFLLNMNQMVPNYTM